MLPSLDPPAGRGDTPRSVASPAVAATGACLGARRTFSIPSRRATQGKLSILTEEISSHFFFPDWHLAV